MRNPLRLFLTQYDQVRAASLEARSLPDAGWREVLKGYHIPVGESQLQADGDLTLTEIGLTLKRDQLPVGLLRSYDLAVELKREVGAHFAWLGDAVMARIRGVNHRIETAEDLFILKEIYRRGVYDCSFDAPVVVIDVGANVGFTTLFFAKQFADAVIEGFEPVPATYARAQRNLSLNPELAARITLHNHGLGQVDFQGQMQFDKERPGNATLIKDNSFTASVAEQVPVTLRKASTVIQEVQDRHAGRRVILKMDCEGSEYQILGELETAGSLKGVSGVLAEWHRVSATEDCDWLCRVLGRNGFFACASDRFAPEVTVGMLQAFRVGTS